MKAAFYLVALTSAIIATAGPTGKDAGVAAPSDNLPSMGDTFEHHSELPFPIAPLCNNKNTSAELQMSNTSLQMLVSMPGAVDSALLAVAIFATSLGTDATNAFRMRAAAPMLDARCAL